MDVVQNILLVIMIVVSVADYVADRQLEKKIDQVLKKRERRRGTSKPEDEAVDGGGGPGDSELTKPLPLPPAVVV